MQIHDIGDIIMEKKILIEKLNSSTKVARLDALRELKKITPEREKVKGYTNNHVHSKYSFSPYSPTRIVYEAYMAGLATVGIMDHDSIAGAKEFIEAGEIFGITTTIGFEVRTDWTATPFNGIRVNNPDQIHSGYICVHGVPHQSIDKAEEFLSIVRIARNERNVKMVKKINELVDGVDLDFEKDIVSVSYANDGGSITERHVLYGLALKLIEKYGRGDKLIGYIENDLKIELADNQKAFLSDFDYEYYDYDLLNILKSSFVSKIYIDAKPPEMPTIKRLIEFCHSIGAIVGYAYLGDVGASPTGDKKEQKFEDDFLDDLAVYLDKMDFDAIAYMPSRNTVKQLKRVMEICEKYDFFQISGEDINQPRQAFICKQLLDKEYIHLVDSTWALVGHENLASENIEKGMFAGKNKQKKLSEKFEYFMNKGRTYEK